MRKKIDQENNIKLALMIKVINKKRNNKLFLMIRKINKKKENKKLLCLNNQLVRGILMISINLKK